MDVPSVTQIFREYAPFVWRTLRYLGVPEADLDDQCQEVFVVVQRRLGEFQGRSTLKTWLYGIALRVAADYRKRAHVRRERLVERLPEGSYSPQQERLAERDLLLRALDTLDEPKRAAFVLHVVEGLTLRELAETLDCPLQTAYARVASARDLLVRRLEGQSTPKVGEEWRTAWISG